MSVEEAAGEVRALLAGAEFGAGIHFGPRGGRLGKGLDLRAVAELGSLLPFADDLEIGHLLEAREYRLLFAIVDFCRQA